MTIATFLEDAKEPILQEAVSFARTLPALSEAEDELLRDHLPKLLEAISADLREGQSRASSIEKSHGNAPAARRETAAQTHGLLRATSGISIAQLVAEYRALRSSVLRLANDVAEPGLDVANIIRFNEAIDQAIAESIEFFETEVERWRQIFLAVLGHDLRNPLSAIAFTSQRMSRGASPELAANAALIGRSVKRITTMLDSLLEWNRSKLGVQMPLDKSEVDLTPACQEEVELLQAAFPDATLRFKVLQSGATARGVYDASRVREALGNLLTNAIKHGNGKEAVVVSLLSDDSRVQVSVENAGSIPAADMDSLFEPLKRGAFAHSARSHLGLGLFIVRLIARAHGGDVDVVSEAGKVRFTISLPKASPAAA